MSQSQCAMFHYGITWKLLILDLLLWKFLYFWSATGWWSSSVHCDALLCEVEMWVERDRQLHNNNNNKRVEKRKCNAICDNNVTLSCICICLASGGVSKLFFLFLRFFFVCDFIFKLYKLQTSLYKRRKKRCFLFVEAQQWQEKETYNILSCKF